MVTRSGWFRMWVVCGSFLRQCFPRMGHEVHRASRGRSPYASPHPEMVKGRSVGRRRVVRDEGGNAARFGGHAPYTKGNFQFVRTIAGWRERYALLDIRRNSNIFMANGALN